MIGRGRDCARCWVWQPDSLQTDVDRQDARYRSKQPRASSLGISSLIGLFALIQLALPVAAQVPSSPGQIEIKYQDPDQNKPDYQKYVEIRARLKTFEVLEKLKRFLAPLNLPKDQLLILQLAGCDGALQRPYEKLGTRGTVTICYERVRDVEDVAARTPTEATHAALTRIMMNAGVGELQRAAFIRVGTFVMVALHEVAPAIFDMLEVPIWGNSEDAADHLAAFLMVQFSEDVASTTIFATAMYFELSGGAFPATNLTPQRSPAAQRYYDYLCIAYGGRPHTFRPLLDLKILPADRARWCRTSDYEQIRKAFNLRIMPHIDADKLVRVRAMQSLLN